MKKMTLSTLLLAAGLYTAPALSKAPISVDVDIDVITGVQKCGDKAACTLTVQKVGSSIPLSCCGDPTTLTVTEDFGKVDTPKKVTLKVDESRATIYKFTNKDGKDVFVGLKFFPGRPGTNQEQDLFGLFLVGKDIDPNADWPVAAELTSGKDVDLKEGVEMTLQPDGTVSVYDDEEKKVENIPATTA